MAKRAIELVEFHPSPKSGGGTLTPLEKDPGPSNSDFKDDPLISRLIEPVTLPQELWIPSSGRKVRLKALLDSGCTRCLISPTLVGKLGVHLKRPKNPIAFCQLDGSIVGGIPAMFDIEPLELAMRNHTKTLIFFHGTRDGMALHLRADMAKVMEPTGELERGMSEIPKGGPSSCGGSHKAGDRPSREAAAVLKGELPQGIPQEYWDLDEVFSEMGSDKLHPPSTHILCYQDHPQGQAAKTKIVFHNPQRTRRVAHLHRQKHSSGFHSTCETQSSCPGTVPGEERWVSLLMR